MATCDASGYLREQQYNGLRLPWKRAFDSALTFIRGQAIVAVPASRAGAWKLEFTDLHLTA